MFDFLKSVLGVPSPVEVIGYEAPEVILRTEKPMELGLAYVKAEISGVKIKAQVQVVESGLQECRALWIKPEEALPLLIEVFTPNEQRAAPRYRRKLRVRSPRLEGYQGNTIDLSRTGMRVEAHGKVDLGTVVPVAFELDDAGETEVSIQAKVRWVAPSEKDGTVAMGLEFVDFDEKHHTALFDSYMKFLDRISGEAEL